MNRIHPGAGIALAALTALPAQDTLVGVYELEPGLVHPLIQPHIEGRAMDGLELGLHESMPLVVKLTPGKRAGEYRMAGEPKLGKTRLIMPGLINAKLQYYGSRKFRRPARFEITESVSGRLSIKNHVGSLGRVGEVEITFVDLDHDGALGTTADGYVVKAKKQKQWIDRAGGIDLRKMTDPIEIDGATYWLECDPPGFELVVTDKEPDFTLLRAQDYQRALAHLNELRARLGHPPVTLDNELSSACLEHALYCAQNGGLTHEQVRGKPGYTAAGARAAQRSELAYSSSMDAAIRVWLDTFYHRVEMLGPNLTRVGMGLAQGVAALDAQSARKRGTFAPYAWPPDGSADVPCRWRGGEWPSPVGTEPFDAETARGWGYPISITFPSEAVTDVVATVRAGDAELEVFVSSPERPGNQAIASNVRSILVMSTQPLPPDTAIEVDVRCSFAKKPYARKWSFTTGRN